jgi:multiple sugar transport system ATP-binding protein
VNDVPPKDRDIAMVFQNYALYPHMTVTENMSFGLRLKRFAQEVISGRVSEAAQILDIRELLERKPRQLSGGQRQRVAMGRAIVRHAKVFLFDEPLSNLDAKLRVQMRAEIKELHQRLKVTTVYVTHDQIEAMTMADKIVVMNHGHIEQAGAPLELYDRPANLFVAGFIGSPAMNMLHGKVSAGAFVDASGMRWPMPANHGAAEGSEIVYGVRPEHLRLDANGVPTRVHVVEPTGSETQVVLRLGEVSLMGAFRERIAAGPGEALPVSPELGLVHLFDKKTGKRI